MIPVVLIAADRLLLSVRFNLRTGKTALRLLLRTPNGKNAPHIILIKT